MRLVSIHPDLRRYGSTISKAKEQTALAELESLFPQPQYRVRQNVVIQGLTDVDLLVYERSTGFVLAMQHKWFAAPDTLRESASNDERLQEGVGQAAASSDAFRESHESIRTALNILQEDPVGEVEAVVVCRGSEPTGFLGNSQVPIITELAFRRLRSEADSLPALWSLIVTRPDQREAAESFENGEMSFSLFGYGFVMPAISIS